MVTAAGPRRPEAGGAQVSERTLPRYNGTAFDGITPEMQSSYLRDGFLILEKLINPDDCARLMADMQRILDGFDPAEHSTVFSTLENPQNNEQYFLESGRQIRFFFEDGAFDDEGRLTAVFRQSLNKVGHGLHDLDEAFDRFSRQPAFRAIASGLGLGKPLLLQSMYIFKPPRIGGEVLCHQDATYLWTEPQSVLGIWLALEEATVENGCLWGIPGSHLEAAPRRRFRRAPDGAGAGIEVLDPRAWPDRDCAPLEVPRGTVIALHGQFAHRSGANTSERSREAYALHLVDGACEYPADNWLQWPADNPPRGFNGEGANLT